jgi:hypothetical protein
MSHPRYQPTHSGPHRGGCCIAIALYLSSDESDQVIFRKVIAAQ